MVGVYDGSSRVAALWIDGRKRAQKDVSDSVGKLFNGYHDIPERGALLSIGIPFRDGQPSSDSRAGGFVGQIDDVRVYNYALSGGEIADLCTSF